MKPSWKYALIGLAVLLILALIVKAVSTPRRVVMPQGCYGCGYSSYPSSTYVDNSSTVYQGGYAALGATRPRASVNRTTPKPSGASVITAPKVSKPTSRPTSSNTYSGGAYSSGVTRTPTYTRPTYSRPSSSYNRSSSSLSYSRPSSSSVSGGSFGGRRR